MEPDDHDLMRSVRDGDTDCLGQIFERHHKPLYGFFVRLTGRSACSEDMVQQVFHRMLKYRHTYRDDGQFRSWMYHLARKVAADHYHKASRRPTLLDEPELAERVPDQANHAADEAERNDDLGLMRKALAEMPDAERELLVLHRFQHLPHETLAQLHNCSTGAMKVRVHRALQTLRERFFRLTRNNS